MSNTEAEVERLRANLEQVRGSADAWWQMYSDELAAHEQTKAALIAARRDVLAEAADSLLASLDDAPLLRGLVSINGGAQAMRDYAVEHLHEMAQEEGR